MARHGDKEVIGYCLSVVFTLTLRLGLLLYQLRLYYNHLMAQQRASTNSDAEPLLRSQESSAIDGVDWALDTTERSEISKRSLFLVRAIALLCICSLSVGVHYATYILAPLKSRIQRELGTSHAEFGVLFSAYSLNSTWTPLVAGLLVSRLGTTVASILATCTIFLGQCILLTGELWRDIRLMAFGLFVFGMGSTPLAVVQETIVVRFFRSHGLGVSMAFGLIAGKGSSFVAARTSYSLTVQFGSSAPFYVATLLTGFSVLINLVYLMCSRWLVNSTRAELEAPDLIRDANQAADTTKALTLKETAEKRKVRIIEIAELGDLFWAYIGFNVLCGMIWNPFNQLAANIIEKRYGLTEQEAATTASYLLAGPVILYPVCGLVVDMFKDLPIATYLLALSSVFTASAYTWLAAPPTWTKNPMPAILSFALGYGFAPLMVVVIVPKIVNQKYVSTALGAHKSLEQTGTTLFQTLIGLLLDVTSKTVSISAAGQQALDIFLFLNCLHMLSIALLAVLQRRRVIDCKDVHEIPQLGMNFEEPSTTTQRAMSDQSSSSGHFDTPLQHDSISTLERRRGQTFVVAAVILVIAAWVLFFGTAYYRLERNPR